jgi:hypothetical protein
VAAWLLLLLAWTALGGLWQLAALGLLAWGVHARKAPVRGGKDGGAPGIALSLFKPLPPPGTREEQASVLASLASFCRQLDPARHECLVGLRAEDAEAWAEVRAALETRFPAAPIRFVVESSLPCRANPKVAWLEHLAGLARGGWWLWSDADITAPEGFLEECDTLRGRITRDFATFPYLIRGSRTGAGAWDLAFNLSEFMPGVFLLGACGGVRFTLGAGTLLRADAFRARMSWEELGQRLADDHWVGQNLGPGILGAAVLRTDACEDSIRSGFRHYLRWLKTIRWCQPAGFAAQGLVYPALGWWLAALLGGGAVAWSGLALVAAGETFLLALACLIAGCFPFGRAVPWFYAICLARPWLRLACWLPWAVDWRDRLWRGPVQAGLPERTS